MTDTLKIQVLIQNLILTQRKTSQCPAGHNRPVLVSCNCCSPPPTDPSSPIPLHGHQPCQALAEFPRKPISTLIGASRDASRQTPRRPAVYSLDYICLPVCLSHYLYNVSMEMGGLLLGEDGA